MGEKYLRTDREFVIVQATDGRQFTLTMETEIYEIHTQSTRGQPFPHRPKYFWNGQPVSDMGNGRFVIFHPSPNEDQVEAWLVDDAKPNE
jgi:hypothetical protein